MTSRDALLAEVQAELDSAKRSNLPCLAHAEDHPTRRVVSVWRFSYLDHRGRRDFMRSRCGRPRRLGA